MRLSVILFLFAAVFALCAAGRSASAAPIDDFEKQFAFPGSEYGGAPFWAWDEKLVPDEMIRQVDELNAGGMGGFFMHARQGRITPYLGKDWMNGVRISVDEAKKLGMKAYLYDEDRWPSGFAGGIVPKENPEFRQKALMLLEKDAPLQPSDVDPEWKLVRVFAVQLNGDFIVSSSNVTPPSGVAPAGDVAGKKLMYFFQVYMQPKEWFNNSTYIDTLNPDAVDAFIKSTYEAYKSVVGDEFGKTVPAIFTDEPCYIMRNDLPPNSIPWTDKFADYFSASKDYDIRDFLPVLFHDSPNARRIRLDYWTAATERFRDTYGKRLFDWSAANNIEFTGHYMSEDNLLSQINWIGAAMPMYEYQQRPGMDHLGRNINDPMTAKQVSSAAHQFGRPLILTETYGCAGWNLSFENMKWIADWHYVLGVNFMNQHLAWYTMRGCRKRDYPCSIHYQSPWWRYHKIFGDYLRRATFALSQGDYVADVLVLHPITSAWAEYSPLNSDKVQRLNNQFTSLINFLNEKQIDYDFGDELIIARHGSVNGDRFVVGKMSYRTVIIPPGVTLRHTTFDLLQKFVAAGGKVAMISPLPTLLDARDPMRLEGGVPVADNDEALATVAPALADHVTLTPSGESKIDSVFIHQRAVGGTRIIFFANTNQEKTVDATAALPLSGHVRVWDLFTGKISDYPAETSAGKPVVKVHLEPSGSLLLSVTPGAAPAVAPPAEPVLVRSENVPEEWSVANIDANAETLDLFYYKREVDSVWSQRVAQFMAQDALESSGGGKTFQLRYNFKLSFDPKTAKEMFLVVEQPEVYKMTLNGVPIRYEGAGWWRDMQFKRIDIRNIAVEGKNTLEMTGTFQLPRIPNTLDYTENGVEVEAVYIVGDFIVRPEGNGLFVIKPSVTQVRTGDLAKQGFPFFSGSVTLEREIEVNAQPGEKVFLEFDGLEAITTQVTVNGKVAGVIAFHPHRVDITPFVRNGANSVQVELTDSNRNLMGPHHDWEKEPLSVGPGTFRNFATKGYNFIPFGITGGVRVAYYK